MVDSIENQIPAKYSSLFTGLGNFLDTYEIRLTSDAKPHSLFTPRNIPLPLWQKAQDELTRMETLGVISKIDEPTLCCTRMMIIPKKDGSVCICVDFRQLNESVMREVHTSIAKSGRDISTATRDNNVQQS